MTSDRATCRTCKWFRDAGNAPFHDSECMFSPPTWQRSAGNLRPTTHADDYCSQHQPEPDPEAF